MVKLSRIYTKTGDDGTTGLGDGSRLPKHHLRVAAYGTSDELSAILGLLLTEGVPKPLHDQIRVIQNDLFDLGSDLCVPGHDDGRPRLDSAYTAKLEAWIDEANANLQPLSSFILPGGTRAAAWLHLARCTCRRAERLVSELISSPEEAPRVNPEVLRYLNRLSDLLFVLGRDANDHGKADVLWVPGQSAT